MPIFATLSHSAPALPVFPSEFRAEVNFEETRVMAHGAILQWRPHDRSWSRFGIPECDWRSDRQTESIIANWVSPSEDLYSPRGEKSAGRHLLCKSLSPVDFNTGQSLLLCGRIIIHSPPPLQIRPSHYSLASPTQKSSLPYNAVLQPFFFFILLQQVSSNGPLGVALYRWSVMA